LVCSFLNLLKIQRELNRIIKKIIFITLLSLINFELFSQGEFNIWYFGLHAGVSFNFNPPIALSDNNPMGFMATSTISDSLGNLKFYSDGKSIYDKYLNLMPHGNGLGGSGWAQQGVLAVQKLDDDSSYFLFTVDLCEWPYNSPHSGLQYSIINMRLNNKLGDIDPFQKNISLYSGYYASSAMTGIRAHNNKDVWIIVRIQDSTNHFASYKISSTGLDTIPVISLSSVQFEMSEDGPSVHFLRVSPDGNKLACIYASIIPPLIEYCSFNDTTGIITPIYTFNPTLGFPPYYCHSLEFSIDNSFLYVLGHNNPLNLNGIFQYNTNSQDSSQMKQSEVLVGYYYGATNKLQRGPDHKIYLSEYYKDSLGVINQPTLQGNLCDFQASSFSLNGHKCLYGLPDFLDRYYVYIHQTNDCLGDSVYFTGAIWPPADSVRWDFGDPLSGSKNHSTSDTAYHAYSSPGQYTVMLYIRHIDHRTDTAWQVVTILPGPQPALGPDRTICVGDSVIFDAGACAGCIYEWSDLTHGLMNIGNNQTYTAHIAAQYMAKVTGSNNCSGTDTVVLSTTPVPVVTNSPLSKDICSIESTNIPLTSNPPGANFYWTASLTSGNITGFYADSGLVINQVLVNHNSSPGLVTYNITPKAGSCVGTPADYAVTVNPGDSVKISIAASANNVCAGTSVTFIASPTNGGTNPSYQWKVNSVYSGANSPIFIYTPNNGNLVQCVLTSSNTICISNNPATSNTITMIVNPNLPVSVSVTPSANPVCAGTLVTFTATPTNGGTTPSYQWKVNGGNVGANNSVYTYVPANGDLVWCILTSSEVCTSNNPASSIQHQMVVNPLLPVSITISASSNPFCIGNSVTFTATHTNGGSSPSYQWKLNGSNVGTNNHIYTYVPANGDMVSCVFTSSASCVTGNPATSNTITMTGTTGLPAGVSIVAIPNPFCPGSSVTCTATPGNGGTNPVYQWKVNGVNVGMNSPTYTFNPLNNDSVRCVMTSNLSCVSGNPATSNKIILSGTLAPIVTFTRCFDSITRINAKPIKLKGGIPLGGTYSGPGVNSTTGVFTPSVAGIGTKTITYSYTNVALCSASKTKTIIVQSAPAFTCGNNLTDIRDDKVYPTIQFGSQCWMASNLNYGTMILASSHQRDNCSNEKYCYQDLSANCNVQGANYQWDEIMRYDDTPGLQGLCPPAWHVPTEAEWNILFANWTNNAFAGAPLKYSGYSGFNALLSGVRHLNVQWDYQNIATFFWSSTPYGAYKAWSHGMNDYDPSVAVYPAYRINAFSVRCIKDN
jgi:uncharacterized protein (TIGR02145 family)